MSFDGPTLPFPLLAFLAWRVIISHDLPISDSAPCRLFFTKRYCSQSPSSKWARWCNKGTNACHLQFRIRHLSISKNVTTRASSHQAKGLGFHRESESPFWLGTNSRTDFVESRVAIAVSTSFRSYRASFSMVTLTDTPLSLHSLEDQNAWNEAGINPRGPWAGVAVFQVGIFVVLREWSWSWNIFLDVVSRNLQAQVHYSWLSKFPI